MTHELDWMIPGATHDKQSVTPNWEQVRELIPGVRVYEPKNVLTGYGRLVEVFRTDWNLPGGPIDQVFQATFMTGKISAWHAHAHTTDRIFVNTGTLRIVLYHKQTGMINELQFGQHRPGLIIIPPGVWHGVQNVGNGVSSLLNLVDRAYSYTEPDHFRLPSDTPEIPYRFKHKSSASSSDPLET